MIKAYVNPEILESEWVEGKKDKNGNEAWGHQLKPGAPESVRREFEQFEERYKNHRTENVVKAAENSGVNSES